MALLLAAIHGLLGGIVLPILAILTSLANIFLFSPVGDMGLTSTLITGLLVLASGYSVKHALGARLLG